MSQALDAEAYRLLLRQLGEAQDKIERLEADMAEIRAEFDVVAADIRAVFHERPALYKAIVRADAIALFAGKEERHLSLEEQKVMHKALRRTAGKEGE